MRFRTGWAAAALTIAAVCALAGGGQAGAQSNGPSRTDCVRNTFLDYRDQPGPGERNPGVSGALFALSQDYPDDKPEPANPEVDYPWLAVDVSQLDTDDGALGYINVVKSYVLEGNQAVDWVVQDNTTRPWFHVPWLDTSIAGREYRHGLTNELNTPPLVLAPEQSLAAQTWAMGAYNAPGGWAIGQVWCDPDNPDPNALNPGIGVPNSFPNGTAVFKLLFTSATLDQAPFLEGTKVWTANIYPKPLDAKVSDPNNPDNEARVPARVDSEVRLIQLDVGVRDDRLPNGWAFMTFAYSNVNEGDSVFDRMAPVGLQWGNDPGVTPAMIARGGVDLTGTWINAALSDRQKYYNNHLGWGGRLSGPLDNPNSSCMSCHQTAGTPAVPIVPEAASWFERGDRTVLPDEQRLPWFADVPAGVPFSITQRASLDYSLQMTIGLQRFYSATCHPNLADEIVSGRGPGSPVPVNSATTQAACGELAATVVATNVDRPWWVTVVWVVAGLGLGLGLGHLRTRQGVGEVHADESQDRRGPTTKEISDD